MSKDCHGKATSRRVGRPPCPRHGVGMTVGVMERPFPRTSTPSLASPPGRTQAGAVGGGQLPRADPKPLTQASVRMRGPLSVGDPFFRSTLSPEDCGCRQGPGNPTGPWRTTPCSPSLTGQIVGPQAWGLLVWYLFSRHPFVHSSTVQTSMGREPTTASGTVLGTGDMAHRQHVRPSGEARAPNTARGMMGTWAELQVEAVGGPASQEGM